MRTTHTEAAKLPTGTAKVLAGNRPLPEPEEDFTSVAGATRTGDHSPTFTRPLSSRESS
jgi:hypothetical protein